MESEDGGAQFQKQVTAVGTCRAGTAHRSEFTPPEKIKNFFSFSVRVPPPSAAAMAAAAAGPGGPPAPGGGWATGVVLAVSGLPRARRAEVQAVLEAAGGRSGPRSQRCGGGAATWRSVSAFCCWCIQTVREARWQASADRCAVWAHVLLLPFFAGGVCVGGAEAPAPRQQEDGPIPSVKYFLWSWCCARVASPARLALLCGWQLGQSWLRQEQAVWVIGQVLQRTDSAVYAPAGGARHDQ